MAMLPPARTRTHTHLRQFVGAHDAQHAGDVDELGEVEEGAVAGAPVDGLDTLEMQAVRDQAQVLRQTGGQEGRGVVVTKRWCTTAVGRRVRGGRTKGPMKTKWGSTQRVRVDTMGE